jgi:hypothetical protein
VLSGWKEETLIVLVVECEMRKVVGDTPFGHIVRKSPAVVFLSGFIAHWRGRGKTFKEELFNFARETSTAKIWQCFLDQRHIIFVVVSRNDPGHRVPHQHKKDRLVGLPVNPVDPLIQMDTNE